MVLHWICDCFQIQIHCRSLTLWLCRGGMALRTNACAHIEKQSKARKQESKQISKQTIANNQLTNQPTNQPINQSINQSMNQSSISVKQSVKQAHKHTINDIKSCLIKRWRTESSPKPKDFTPETNHALIDMRCPSGKIVSALLPIRLTSWGNMGLNGDLMGIFWVVEYEITGNGCGFSSENGGMKPLDFRGSKASGPYYDYWLLYSLPPT